MTDVTFTTQQAINNATSYRGFNIGTVSIKGDSRYVTVLFDKDFNVLEESICTVNDMKEYVDKCNRGE